MKCKLGKGACSDLVAWVTRTAFMDNVDQEDLACRDSALVHDWYHPSWFWRSDGGELYFTPPAFELRNDRLCGINGRHRAVLLFRHWDVAPMLLVRPELWPLNRLTEIVQQEIPDETWVEIPDLPINPDIDHNQEPPGVRLPTDLPPVIVIGKKSSAPSKKPMVASNRDNNHE